MFTRGKLRHEFGNLSPTIFCIPFNSPFSNSCTLHVRGRQKYFWYIWLTNYYFYYSKNAALRNSKLLRIRTQSLPTEHERYGPFAFPRRPLPDIKNRFGWQKSPRVNAVNASEAKTCIHQSQCLLSALQNVTLIEVKLSEL